MTGAAPWQPVPDGVVLAVRLTPRGGRDAIDGVARLADGAVVLKARVAAAAVDGAANEALLGLIAGQIGVPRRDVSLQSGAASRVKRVKVVGRSAALVATLAKIAPVG